jgi:hypothetical protein
MKLLTRDDIDMSVPVDPELLRRRKEIRRKTQDEMKRTWADPENQCMSLEEFAEQCRERVMQEYDEKFMQETQELIQKETGVRSKNGVE